MPCENPLHRPFLRSRSLATSVRVCWIIHWTAAFSSLMSPGQAVRLHVNLGHNVIPPAALLRSAWRGRTRRGSSTVRVFPTNSSLTPSIRRISARRTSLGPSASRPSRCWSTAARGDRTGSFRRDSCQHQLDLKALAAASGNKRTEFVPLKECCAHRICSWRRFAGGREEGLSGVPGETAELWDVVAVSAGMRGCQMLVSPAGLIRVTGATLAPIGRHLV